ncbi:MAG: 16S rRNA (cytosine(1402)-N(4))-methyltransferase RsmH [Thermotogae bacterium]|nr:16S rRNA (cytosine(1402)-N(4))-methyltransferase RsmH [Thermotogota bacterium]
MVKEVKEWLITNKNGVYVDCTIGSGGHAEAILEEISPHGGKLIGIDKDDYALDITRERLSLMYSGKITLIKGDFRNLRNILGGLNIDKVDGILFDIGLSSIQLEDSQRGFSFSSDGPLDMRMDPIQNRRAYDIINKTSEKELAHLIYEYGEERFSRRIARRIVKDRPIETTIQLVEEIKRAIPPTSRRKRRRHFATRTFQAIRICVNDELNALREGLNAAASSLKIEGRMVVISFHSLEDRIVKHFFIESEELKSMTKKPIQPMEYEVKGNPRSRSAKMRICERI